MRNDLVIVDEEYQLFSQQLNGIGQQIDFKINTLINILLEVVNYGITEGNAHDNLLLFVNQLSTLQQQMSMFTTTIDKDNNLFLQKVEEDDYSIYEGGA